MAKSARAVTETRRGSFGFWFTFIVGIPLGFGMLYLVEHGPWQIPNLQRYVRDDAEKAIAVLFFCCLSAFLGKLLGSMKERLAHGQTILPAWDGKPHDPTEVAQLQQSLSLVWDSVHNTYLGRRIANILNFVASRRSANELDDQIRTLSDNDGMALDGSYAILRFMIWAMPILGFLGTVLGITEAIGSIDPQQLEKGGADNVTRGLTMAFDSTALALALTLVAMFFNSMLEKIEQSLLERVDQYVDGELAHRFTRTQVAGGSASMPLAPGLDKLLEKQVGLWSTSMTKAEERWTQAAPQMAQAMQQAIETALTRFGQRIVETEKKLLERQQNVLDSLNKVAAALKETGSDHQMAIARLTDAIGLSVEAIGKAQADEAQLLKLQETLSQNLALLANSATFEQAVESLTAAIHLLTTRVNPTTPLRIAQNHAA